VRIGIAKPDWGIVGGFERLLARVASELADRGHEVRRYEVKVDGVNPDPFGVEVPPEVRARARDAVSYFGLVEAFRSLDVSDADLVLSSQPPSFAVEHPRQLALFSHHARIYYDLSDAYVRSGFVEAGDHARAERAVRRVDNHYLCNPRYFVAAAEEVKERLARFNGLSDRVGVYHPGSEFAERLLAEPAATEFAAPLCVTRHEFPKRSELFVQAMHELADVDGVCVGTGGRLPFVRELDARLGVGDEVVEIPAEELWLNRGDPGLIGLAACGSRDASGHVDFRGFVDDAELVDLYRRSLCVVAPALLEDYGLTAIEAMACGKPLIVCTDGGGLTRFVEDGVNGFVVEPTGHAIAAAIRRFVDDPTLARELGRNGRERAHEYTWSRAMDEIELGIRAVLD
jgi:glycosyltransferase involved in cell wall biosynthesis